MIDALLARNLLPDWAIRRGIRRLLAQRLRDETAPTPAAQRAKLERFAAELRTMPIAVNTQDSKEQHYEVPTPFYQWCLGPRLKYSCCYYERGTETLAQAEEAMLALTCERAQLVDGQSILELGCGWGSLSLWMAERYPQAKIVAVSHSRTQREHIETEARKRGHKHLTVLTCDMNDFDIAPGRFDRVVSVEMFEHMKNWPRLLANIARWLKPDGQLFVHIFTHRTLAYHFVARDATDWMSRHFFTGGMMPSDNLFDFFTDDLRIEARWRVNGRHYQRTAEHWLQNMDRHREDILPLLADVYGGPAEARKWWAYWRVFYMACAELWGYRGGEEWIVSHYRFGRV